MGEFDAAIEAAKQEVISLREETWREQWARETKQYRSDHYGNRVLDTSHAPAPPDVGPKTWFSIQWKTGYLVADAETIAKLPKRQYDKIMKLGG